MARNSAKAMDEKVVARLARLEAMCQKINKSDFGGEHHDAVMVLGARDGMVLERFPSGCPDIDDALGGGYPVGRFIEFSGSESSGKTTLALHAIKEFQHKYPEDDCALIDVEYSYEDAYAENIGVNTQFLLVSQPDNGEQALNILESLVMSGVKLIVVDSVAALVTKNELDGEMGDQQVGEQARLVAKAMRKLTALCGKRKVTVLFTNQMRDKIGAMGFGEKTETPGGRALKHCASIRLKVSRLGNGEKDVIDGKEVVVSNKVKIEVKKNKTAAPFRTAEFYISFGYGIDSAAAILDNAIACKAITKKGSWMVLNGENIAQGRVKMLEMLRTDEHIKTLVEGAVTKAKAGVPASEAVIDVTPKRGPVRKPVTRESIDAEVEAIEASATTISISDADETTEVQDA